MPTLQEGEAQITIAVPEGLKEALKRVAAENRRGLRGELLLLMERHVQAHERRRGRRQASESSE